MSIETQEIIKAKESAWHNAQKIMEDIRKRGGFSEYVESLDDFEQAFEVSNEECGCVDEGYDGDLNFAGSGILLSEEDTKNVLLEMKKNGLQVVTTHDGCGAAGIYAESQGISLEDAMKYNEERLKKIAKEIDLEYKHVKADDMSRPVDFHNATTVYYDGTGHFNPEKLSEKLPKGFVVSRPYLENINYNEDSYALAELKVCIDIALGGHGLGNKFTKEKPLIVCIIGDTNNEKYTAENLESEVKDGLDEMIKKYDGRVVIQTVTRPEIQK